MHLHAQANRTQLFGVYSEVKGYVCCGVPDMVSPTWTSLTFAGACRQHHARAHTSAHSQGARLHSPFHVTPLHPAHTPLPPPPACSCCAGIFALAMLFATMWFIGKLDRVPRRDCCGCSCHTRAAYAGTAVLPGGGGELEAPLPQYNTAPGWENAMGPYAAPNGAMAMSAPWSPLDGPVVSVHVGAPAAGGVPKAKAG